MLNPERMDDVARRGDHVKPAIDAWLRRPGQPVEQRFADVLMRVKSGFRRD